MFACMYVCMYIRTYVRIYVCVCVRVITFLTLINVLSVISHLKLNFVKVGGGGGDRGVFILTLLKQNVLSKNLRYII